MGHDYYAFTIVLIAENASVYCLPRDAVATGLAEPIRSLGRGPAKIRTYLTAVKTISIKYLTLTM